MDFFFYPQDKVTGSSGWLQAHYVDEDNLELLICLSLYPTARITAMYRMPGLSCYLVGNSIWIDPREKNSLKQLGAYYMNLYYINIPCAISKFSSDAYGELTLTSSVIYCY